MFGFSDYTNLVDIIGVHYQIRDDYLNLQSTKVNNIAYRVLL